MGIRVFGHVIFDGVDLADFGVTLSGTGTYNAPERDVKPVPVPGRNGDVLFDNGRFFNIEVVYPVNIELGLPDKVSALREFLLSHKGYFRLEDSYHPDKFRMAQFTGPFEINPTGSHNRYGRMTLTFDCMPQRFLKSGEIETEYPDSSKTKQAIYKYTDFSTFSRQNLLDPIAEIFGYDMVNMEYYVINMSGHTGASGNPVIVDGSFEDFFCIMCADDPLTQSSNTSSNRYTQEFVRPSFTPTYWVMPIAANIKIYIDGSLEYESANLEHKTLQNPTLFASRPVVKLSVPADATEPVGYLFAINENGVLMRRSSEYLYNTAQTITIDCETMDAYSLPEDNPQKTRVNWNPCISFLKAPEIRPGNNDLAYDGTISDLKVIPKWWTI